MRKILLFAGTEEGKQIAIYLKKHRIPVHVCVATDYGKELLQESMEDDHDHEMRADVSEQDGTLDISAHRYDESQMKALMEGEQYELVIDATHPYAKLVTENCRRACDSCGITYLRVVRESLQCQERDGKIRFVSSMEEAMVYLEHTEGTILATTGSKEMETYLSLTNGKERVYHRVLSTLPVLERCRDLGIEGRHLFAMQGPFSEELNYAMLQEIGASYLVTKESGQAGGFAEKINGAKRAGVTTVVIGRPVEETGYTLEEMLSYLRDHYVESTDTAETHEKEAISISGTEEVQREKESSISGTEEVQREKESSISGTEEVWKKKAVSGRKEDSGSQEGRSVQLVGIGTGSRQNMTLEAVDAISGADLIFGASRMLSAVKDMAKRSAKLQCEYNPDKILQFIQVHREYESIAVLYSGDIGFYSGAKKLLEKLREVEDSHHDNIRYHCIPGISSPVYLLARLGISWEDVELTSIHGREENLVSKVRTHEKVMTLLGGDQAVRELCETLLENHLEQVRITIGEKLSYPEERIITGTPGELCAMRCDTLAVAYIENPLAGHTIVTHGMEDEAFLRDKVPMTKMEVRSVSVSKLQLTRDAICYDLGAGTGSVTVEMAQQASEGFVYAVEKEVLARDIMAQNLHKFGITNVKIVAGRAKEEMDALPIPTHAFIGGSSGEIAWMIQHLFQRNPNIRIVANVIALDTLSEILNCVKNMSNTGISNARINNAGIDNAGMENIGTTNIGIEYVQLSVAKSKRVGSYEMMMGQNPVYIVTIFNKDAEKHKRRNPNCHVL
ncbi:MAG: precorrin-6A reductase [Lachnospiraceae bacterium]|nr:precorrin-6A reductase [Lachnospiraceae bacterium]